MPEHLAEPSRAGAGAQQAGQSPGWDWWAPAGDPAGSRTANGDTTGSDSRPDHARLTGTGLTGTGLTGTGLTGTGLTGTGPGKSPGRGRGAHRAAGRRTRGTRPPRRPVTFLVIACLAIVAAAAGYLAVRHGGARHPSAASTPPGRASGSSPSGSVPSATALGPWGHIASRVTDPSPLTLTELYPARFSAMGGSFAKTSSRKSTRCSPAVIGARLRRAVRRGGCDQVLRATYLSTASKVMGTIGVLNLKNSAAVVRAGTAAGRAQFIAQLPGKRGPTRELADGTGVEEAVAKGHVLILVWGEFTDLRGPRTKSQRATLEAFLTDLIDNTANLSLTSRMVNGTPATQAQGPAH